MVKVDRMGPVVVVTLDRPEVRNAIDYPTAAAIDEALGDAEADDGVDAMVLAATGPVFCAGSDLKAKARGDRRPVTGRGGFAGFVRWPRTKPLVAAVDGLALGGGFELVLASDLVVAGEGASFGLPEVRHGIIAGGGGLFRLAQRIPFAAASAVVLCGETVDAPTALRFGLVSEVVPAGTARERAVDLAAGLCGERALAVQESLRVMRAATTAGEDRWWELTEEASLRTQRSPQGKRGVAAFAHPGQ